MIKKAILSDRIDILRDDFAGIEMMISGLDRRIRALEERAVAEDIKKYNAERKKKAVKKPVEKKTAKKMKPIVIKREDKIVFGGKVERTVNTKIANYAKKGYRLVSKELEGGSFVVTMKK